MLVLLEAISPLQPKAALGRELMKPWKELSPSEKAARTRKDIETYEDEVKQILANAAEMQEQIAAAELWSNRLASSTETQPFIW